MIFGTTFGGRHFNTAALTVSLTLLLTACQGSDGVDASNSKIPEAVGPEVGTEPAYVPGRVDGEHWGLSNVIHFETDSYALTAEAQDTLRRQAKWLVDSPSLQVTVEGHADERGTREYNLALGERRANATASYLVASGVAAARLSVVSYGKERPDCSPSTDICWAQNRRAVTALNTPQ